MNLRKLLYIILISVFLSGCMSTNSSNANTSASEPTSTPEEIDAQTPAPTNTVAVTPTLSHLEAKETPSSIYPERIISDAECGDETVQGHILFTHRIFRNDRIVEDLYIMDGNGCNSKLVMEDIFGSPDWSIDGKWIAIGCNGGGRICILDAETIIETCYRDQSKICESVVNNEIPVPGTPDIVDHNRIPVSGAPDYVNIGIISWSHTGDKLLVEVYASRPYGGTYLLNLKKDNEWKLLLNGGIEQSEFSPIEDNFIISESYSIREMPLDRLLITYYASGVNAVYSPDGKRITFLAVSGAKNKEPFAIAERDEETIPLIDFLYKPIEYNDDWNWDSFIYLQPSEARILSWSPYDRYLAFIEGERENRIMRLDKETGEVVNLTNNMGFNENSDFVSIVWGP